MKMLNVLFFAFTGFAVAAMAQPTSPASPGTGVPSTPKQIAGLGVPAVWYHYMDEAHKARTGELTFESNGRFKLERWDGLHTDGGKWRRTKEGVTMTITNTKELPGLIKFNGDSAVWHRPIGDRYLGVKP